MKYLKATLLGSGALASLLLSSVLTGCQDEDFGYTAEEIAYQSNFEKTFGKISSDQIWDFSSYNLERLGLTGGPTNDVYGSGSLTRAFSADPDIIRTFTSNRYEVLSTTVDWLNANMTEKHSHKGEGEPFKFINPYFIDKENGGDPSQTPLMGQFLIIPIYQGQSGMTWDLHLVDNQNDYNIWSKSERVSYSKDYNLWEEFVYKPGSDINGNRTTLYLNNAFGDLKGHTSNDVKVKFVVSTGSFKGHFVLWDNSSKKGSQDLSSLGSQYGTQTYNVGETVIDLKPLLGKSSDGANVGNDDNPLGNLQFVIESTTGECTFYAYSGDRVGVFTNFNYKNDTQIYLHDFVTNSNGDFVLDKDGNKQSESYFYGHTINKNHVMAPAMLIDGSKLGREMYMYLETTFTDENNINYSKLGTKHRSDGNPTMMRSLTAFSDESTSPLTNAQVKEMVQNVTGKEINACNFMVVGCEDANGSLGDWDFNDVVLLIVGLPTSPKIAREIVQKRYLIEDLGSTFDFDFNDIVVDVSQERIYEADDNIENSTFRQTATIAHLCGTIPFQVFINGQAITDILPGQNDNDSPDGYDPKRDPEYITKYVKQIVQDDDHKWIPNENNISIRVWPNAKTVQDVNGDGSNSIVGGTNQLDVKAAKQINFPNKGEFPYIIAVDQDINWMQELQAIPRSWLNTTENKNNGVLGEYDDEHNPNQNVFEDADLNGVDLSSLGILVPSTNITNNNDGTETIQFIDGSIFYGYRAGKITMTFLIPKDAPADTEVKGSFICNPHTGGSQHEIPDAYRELKDFTLDSRFSNKFKTQTIELTSDAIQLEAMRRDLQFNVSYATLPFKYSAAADTPQPLTRLYVKWDKIVAGELVSELSNHGKQVVIDNNESINFGSAFNQKYNGVAIDFDEYTDEDKDAYVTFVVPANSSVKGRVGAYNGDLNVSFFSQDISLNNTTNSEKVYTLKLCKEFREMLANGNRNSVKLEGLTLTGSASTLSNVKTYVYWDGFVGSIPEATVPLAKYMMYNWSDTNHSSITSEEAGTNLRLNEDIVNNNGFGYVYGNDIKSNRYADLCETDYLVAVVSSEDGYNGPVFHYNKGMSYNDKTAHEIYGTNTTYLTKFDNNNGTSTWVLDIKKIREKEGCFHLNAITNEWDKKSKVLSINLDKYSCNAEHYATRTLWTGTIQNNSWSGDGTDASLSMVRFTDADTYRNTKLRVYVEKNGNNSKEINLQIRAGGVLPTGVNIYGNIPTQDAGSIDIEMDQTFFDNVKSSGTVNIKGDNLKVTKIELVPFGEDTYNLLLSQPDNIWDKNGNKNNFSIDYSRRPLQVKLNNPNNGHVGWNISTITSQKYSKITIVIDRPLQNNSNDYDTNVSEQTMKDAKITLTCHYGDGQSNEYKGITYDNDKTIVLEYDNTRKCDAIWLESKSNSITFTILKAYLSN